MEILKQKIKLLGEKKMNNRLINILIDFAFKQHKKSFLINDCVDAFVFVWHLFVYSVDDALHAETGLDEDVIVFCVADEKNQIVEVLKDGFVWY